MSGERLGRYIVHDAIASGGMATIHLGRLVGPAGFGRTVAIKRLLGHLAKDPDFVASFVDEARLAARVRHPNVVPTLDVVVDGDETLVVMEYVHGESLSRLLAERASPPPLGITLAIVCQVLSGLHAAHEATGPGGKPLELVHRDVSPQNILVGADGSARLVDFGVAKAAWRLQQTRDTALKGKLSYTAPEQLASRSVDRRTDVFSASVVLWEALTGARLFAGSTPAECAAKILSGDVPRPSSVAPELSHELDEVVLRGLAASPEDRFATALDMAEALESTGELATPREVSAWVSARASAALARRGELVRALEDGSDDRAAVAASPDERPPALVQAALDRARRQEEPTVTETPREAARARSRRRVLALGLVALAVFAGMAAWLRARRAPSATPPLGASSAEVVNASASIAQPTLEPSASTAVGARGAESAARPRVPRPRGASPRAAASAKPGCDPPYTVGPEGIHRFRPECL
jgi:serine/threonine-protein kinase